MNTISLSLVCPHIFQTQIPKTSDVWNKEVRFEKGKTYLVEAASGTGKSSLCSYLCGYRNDYQGDILFDGRNIRQLSINDWSHVRSHQLSYLVQDLRLFPDLTAFENIAIKNQMTHHKSAEQIMEWLSQLGIADKRDVPVKYMSFGQQQRVALVRSLVQPFDFILADEPISHLDDDNAQRMCHLLLSEAQRHQAGVIITSIGKHIDLPYDSIYHL